MAAVYQCRYFLLNITSSKKLIHFYWFQCLKWRKNFFFIDLYSRATSITDVPVLLALGGWTDSSGDKYSRLVSDGSARRRFTLGVVAFLRKHGFKGLHIDWNYPVCWQSNCNKGPASDKQNFAKLVQVRRLKFLFFVELKTVFLGNGKR